MEFRILGTLEIEAADGLVHLGGAKLRALLGVLLVHANETVSAERLIEDLWEGRPPHSAPTTLHTYVSQLRKALGRQVLETRAAGYRLAVEPDALDAARFEGALDGLARAASADAGWVLERLDEALGLWRGPALVEFASAGWALAESARLEGLRLVALEDRADATLALGQHARLVGELESLVAMHPLRERLWAQLMIALYRSDRQADALRAYGRLRTQLGEELGIEPSREVARLEQAILLHEPELDWRASSRDTPDVAAQQEGAPQDLNPRGRALCPVLVGRTRELGVFENALAVAVGGHGRLLAVTGEAGIGKSRLVDAFVERAQSIGCVVLRGSCSEADLTLPYLPLIEALANHFAIADVAAIGEQLGSARRALFHLFPQLHVEGDKATEAPEKPVVFESFVAVLRLLAGTRGALLVVEDLHWADASTRELVEYVARRAASERLLVVATVRSDELHRRHSLTPLLRSWERADCVLEPDPFEARSVGEMIKAVFGESDITEEFVSFLHSLSEGNPFVLEEYLHDAIENGDIYWTPSGWERKPLAELRIPGSVADGILRRLDKVSASDVDVLRAASVLGRSFSHVDVQEVVECDGPTVERALIAGLDLQLLERDAAPNTPPFRFRHALTREVILDDVVLPRRLALHERAAIVLEARGAAPTEVASHLLAAGLVEAAVPSCLAAAAQAFASGAYAAAAEQYQSVLPAIHEPLEHARIVAKIGEAFFLNALPAQAKPLLEEAAAALADSDAAAESAHVRILLGRCWRDLGVLSQAEAAYDAAKAVLESMGPSDDLATAYALLASLRAFSNDGPGARELAERAREIASAAHAPAAHALALNYLGCARFLEGDTNEGIALTDRSYEEAAALGLDDLALLALSNAMVSRLRVLRSTEGLELLERLRALPPSQQRDATEMILRQSIDFDTSDLRTAWASNRKVVALSQHTGPTMQSLPNSCDAAILLTELGRTEEARVLLDSELADAEVEHEQQDAHDLLIVALRLAIADRDPAKAAQAARRAIAADEYLVAEPAGLLLLIEAYVTAGEPNEAIRMFDESRVPQRQRDDARYQLARGLAALARGDAAAAVDDLRAGADELAVRMIRLSEARARLWLAEALARSGERERAAAELVKVRQICATLGAALVNQQADDLANRLDLSITPIPHATSLPATTAVSVAVAAIFDAQRPTNARLVADWAKSQLTERSGDLAHDRPYELVAVFKDGDDTSDRALSYARTVASKAALSRVDVQISVISVDFSNQTDDVLCRAAVELATDAAPGTIRVDPALARELDELGLTDGSLSAPRTR